MTLTAAQINDELDRLEWANAENMAEELGLWGWGKWARDHGSNLGYPRCLLPFAAKGWGERDLTRVITDITADRALLIDTTVARLPLQHKSVIVAVYKAWIPVRVLPMKMGIPRSRFEQYHNQGVGMLWMALNSA